MATAGDLGGTVLRAGWGGGGQHGRRHGRLWRLAFVLAIVGIVLVSLAVMIRVVVDPIATHYTRKGLKEAEGLKADFQRVHVTLLPPGYEIKRLKIREGGARAAGRDPLLYVQTARVSVDWRELFHRRLNASLTLVRPKVTIVQRGSASAEAPDAKPAKSEEKAPAKQGKASGLSALEESLAQVLPLRVDRIDIVDGELLLRDNTVETTPEIWVNGLDATLKNLATRQELANGRPASLALSGRLGRSGAIAMKLSADPFADPLRFDGEFSVRDWKLVELYDILKATADVQATAGTVALYVKFKVRNNAISGKVKPVLKNVKLESATEDLGDRLKAWVADKALQLKGGGDEKREVGAEIPIQGRLDPNEQLWPAVLDVVRNAFAEGIKAGLGRPTKGS